MSVKVQSVVWKHSRCGGSALLLLLALADIADDAGVAYPSVAALARKIRMSERNTHYLIKKLCSMDELSVEVGAGPRGCNLFRVHTSRGAKITDEPAIFAGVQSFQGAPPFRKGVQSAAPNTSLIRHDNDNNTALAGSLILKSKTPPRNSPAMPVVLSEEGVFDGITPAQIDRWREAFSAIDVRAEISRAEVWLQANPKQRKSNYARFLVNWLARAQDRGHKAAAPPRVSAGLSSTAAIDYHVGVDVDGRF